MPSYDRPIHSHIGQNAPGLGAAVEPFREVADQPGASIAGDGRGGGRVKAVFEDEPVAKGPSGFA